MVNKLDSFHKTKAGLLLFAVIELILAYGFISLAIASGNIWWYLVTLVFFVGFLQNLGKLVTKIVVQKV